MYSAVTLAALLSAAATVSATYGRYPCSYVYDGAIVKDGTMCYDTYLAANPSPYYDANNVGNVDNGGYKTNGYVPTNSVCAEDYSSGNFYCGIEGATCSQAGIDAGADTNCDNGSCVGGFCAGTVGTACTLDSNCLGFIYCTDAYGDATQSGVCGGVNSPTDTTDSGSYCDDGTISNGGLTATSADAGSVQTILDGLCVSNFCTTLYNQALWPANAQVGECATETLAPSAKSRARRSEISPRGSRCPASHTACSVPGSARGFECVDTTSNLEQCGGCAGAGGVDCTALAGVDAVGCVAGQCEIWACAEGFAWDAASASCTVALVA